MKNLQNQNPRFNRFFAQALVFLGILWAVALSTPANAQPPFKPNKPVANSLNLKFGSKVEEYKPNVSSRTKRQLQTQLPFFTRVQSLEVEIVEGFVIMEGDIILGSELQLFGDNAAAITGSNYRWPNGEIPYKIQSGHSARADILTAIETVNTTTTLCMVERTTEPDYVEFVSGSGCASYVGRQTGRQEILIGACGVGSIVHEICHAAGLFHEQTRQDRDTRVRINWNNIIAGKEHNFQKYSDRGYSGADLGGYDFGSIMHYPATAFSKNGQPTIESLTSGVTFGQRTALSPGDISALHAIYPAASGCGAQEDCVSFNPNTIEIKPFGTKYRIVDGSHALYVFPNITEAQAAYNIIKHYKVNRSCFVGRPDPSFKYVTKSGAAPQGAFSGEDCISFNPINATVQPFGAQYRIVDGNHALFVFPNQSEAINALNIIKQYGFTKTCFVGRPDPSFSYLRK